MPNGGSKIAVSHYPSLNYVAGLFRKLGGNQTGILPSNIVYAPSMSGEPHMWSMTCKMPEYHKITFADPEMEMEYHLSGYGNSAHEAFIRMTGEAVERYGGLMSAGFLKPSVRHATRQELLSEGHRVMPLEYLNILGDDQQRFLASQLPKFSDTHATDDDVLGWIEVPSLVVPGRLIWAPAQQFLMGYDVTPDTGEGLITPTFSTGTAAHTSMHDALRNAVTEAVQIDGFMLNWYTDMAGSVVEVDDPALQDLLDAMNHGSDGSYRTIVVDISAPDMSLPNFGTYTVRRDGGIPSMTYGVQADFSPRRAVWRSIQESAAIIGMGTSIAMFNTEAVRAALEPDAPFMDLDSNVLHYAAKPFDADDVQSSDDPPVALSSFPETGDIGDLGSLISEVAKISEWASYLNITPPELEGTPWQVMRVFIPELVSMSLPGMPPANHPRLRRFGGVTNGRPHPLP